MSDLHTLPTLGDVASFITYAQQRHLATQERVGRFSERGLVDQWT